MTTNPPDDEPRDLASGGEASPAAPPTSGEPGRMWYPVPLSMAALNLTGAVALVGLVATRAVSASDLVIFAVSYVLGMVGLEVGLHRYFSHRTFEAKPALRFALALLGSMGGQGSVLLWSTNHRKHHRFADQETDPHSPAPRGPGVAGVVRGLWHGHFAWHFRETSAIELRDYHRYSRDLITDRALMRFDRFYWIWLALGLVAPALAGLLLTGTAWGAFTGFLWGGPIRILFADNVIWAINSLAHRYGPQPFAGRDHSTNVAWLALLSLGGGWHNNHHAFPGSARVGLARGQIDAGYWCIRAFERLGLARGVQVSKLHEEPAGSNTR